MKITVSSAKVLRIVVSDCGTSAMYIVYNKGPKLLHWGIPESIGKGVKFRFCMFSVNMILGN